VRETRDRHRSPSDRSPSYRNPSYLGLARDSLLVTPPCGTRPLHL